MGDRLPDLCIVNATLILPDRLVEDGAIRVRAGRIVEVGPAGEVSTGGERCVDAGGAYAAPGFIDMHVHGGGGADFMDGSADAFDTAIAAHARHGTTSIVPTSTVAEHERILAFLSHTRAAKARGPIPERGLGRVIGAHLYGPYFAEEKVGCHPKEAARRPTRKEFEQYLAFSDAMLTATCAPELPGAAEFYAAASKKGVRLNAGHSNATWREMAAAYELGVRHVDHFYCAMSSVVSLRPRCGMPMQASMMEFVLATDDMTTELIADGKHLSPELLRFVLKMKGARRTALVTDCNRALDLPPGEYIFGPLDAGEPFYSDGAVGLTLDRQGLASSIRGMDFMVRHLHQACGVNLSTAVRMASLTPAEILGVDSELGSLTPGKRADIVLLNAELEVTSVFIDGHPMPC